MFFKPKPPPYDLSNLTLLVVEDSPYMQSLIASMLKAFGVGDIMACENGREAIDLLTITQARQTSRYITNVDIVLSDWLMPSSSGRDLLHWIRRHEDDSVKFLPVIIVSGYATEIMSSQARDMGANEILVKPVSGTKLASRICSVVDHPRPFVDVPGYFGPDRRRQAQPFTGRDRRVMKPEFIEVMHGRK